MSLIEAFEAYVERPARDYSVEPGPKDPQRRFVFMVFHWPESGRGQSLAASMREMRERLLAMPGCVDVAPPYAADVEGECLVGISTWESKEAFDAAGIPRAPSDETVDGETRPRQRFLLEEILSG